jgi:hypothetical protein
MSENFIKEVPFNNDDFRKSIYNGDLYKIPSNNTSLEIVNNVISLIEEEFKTKDIRQVYKNLSNEDFFYSIGRIRKNLFKENNLRDLIVSFLTDLKFNLSDCIVEPFRLRAICPNGHLNPLAAPVYYPHRDTWYSHSQSLIVFWIPLYDLKEEETFEFYPEFFNKSVSNNSEVFNYDNWIKSGDEKRIGWQKLDTGIKSLYPTSKDDMVINNKVKFDCDKGDIIVFSGSHYHKTLEQNTDLTRFSVDFRLVNTKDHENNFGAPNVDNRSKGSALKDYISLV